MRAGTFTIDDFDAADRVLIVAEIGNNHEGQVEVARRMVTEAAAAGADAVKFQTFRTEQFVSPGDSERFARMKRFELTFPEFAELAAVAKSLGLIFISTPLDLESAEFLDGIVDAYKIASGDNTFYPLIRRVAQTPKPMMVSTGLSDLAQIKRTVEEVERYRPPEGQLAILHCVSEYPTSPEHASVGAIQALAEAFPYPIGYSDHTLGSDAVMLAVALGARVIEKHFTLAEVAAGSSFRDHALSADETGLRDLVDRVRRAEVIVGEREKRVQPGEAEQSTALRRSIVARSNLPEGHVLRDGDIMWLRPGDGVAPGDEDLLLGRRLRRNVTGAEQILLDDVEDVVQA